MIVDHRVHVVVADPRSLAGTGGAHLSAVGFPPSAVGDLADLLDVDVDQFAGAVTFVAHRCGLGGSDHHTGQRVTFAEVGQSASTQHPGDGPGGDAELGTDPVLAAAFLAALGHDRLLHLDRRLGGTVMRARRPVVQA